MEDYDEYMERMGDELFEYCRFGPRSTGLNVNIYIDQDHSYIQRSHPLWLYASVYDEVDDRMRFIPIPVLEEDYSNVEGIDDEELEKIKRFIDLNKEIIIKAATGDVSIFNIAKRLKKVDDELVKIVVPWC